jgi:hypothetical protein
VARRLPMKIEVVALDRVVGTSVALKALGTGNETVRGVRRARWPPTGGLGQRRHPLTGGPAPN